MNGPRKSESPEATIARLRRKLAALEADRAESRDTERALREVAEGASAAVGEAFFRGLVTHLAKALGTSHALVAEVADETGRRARSIAWYGDGAMLPGFEYDLSGTPCENVLLERRPCSHAQGVQELFPDDAMLVEIGAQGYVGVPLIGSTGRSLGLIAVLGRKPIANPRQAPAFLQIFAVRAAAELERRLGEARRERLEAELRRSRTLESLGALAGGVAHDFNNLLTEVGGGAWLVRQSLPEDSPLQERLRTIEGAAKRAARLTQQLLEYAGQASRRSEPVQLSQLVQETAALLRGPLGGRADRDLAADLPAIDGDPEQLRRLVTNLLLNAVEALDGNAGAVQLGTQLCELPPNGARSVLGQPVPAGPYVVLEVADSGCGMDAATQERSFDPFFTTKLPGRGLGLSAVLGIAQGHGACLTLESAPGRGTTVRVLFPARPSTRREGAEETSPLRSPASLARAGPRRVLVVDDEDAIREIARTALVRAGFQVETAASGREAVSLLRHRCERADDIDLVVLDLTMPDLDGADTLSALRAIRPETRVLISSGWAEARVRAELPRDGFADFLQKPYLPARLVERVRSLLAEA